MQNNLLPDFLTSLLQSHYSSEDYERILSGFASKRAVTLRANRLKTTPEKMFGMLQNAGIAASKVPWFPDAAILPASDEEEIRALPAYTDGEIYLQSLSSMIPPVLLAPKAGENILDMAAAPGGKTTQIASMTEGKAMITACERNSARAQRLKFNLERQGAGRVTVMNIDARQLDDFFRFDRILLDAPCSGSGTCSTLPGSRNGQFSKDFLAKNCKAQTDLLRKALNLLKPGGTLVYSTCSIFPEENGEILRKCIAGKAEIVPIDPAEFTGVPTMPGNVPGTLTIAPDALYEGFFAARMIRR